ncbi:hypothetical protein BSKO_12133 [Bryopsis sp. KO-2023]|nr:hypothetical protein BSKO_12133 [Bryopsis sp. KO-2023]
MVLQILETARARLGSGQWATFRQWLGFGEHKLSCAGQLTDSDALPTKNVLVTGGLGFIGSHTVLALLDAGCRVTLMDNLHNSSLKAFSRMKALAGSKASWMRFEKADLRDEKALDKLLGSEKFAAVVHFAGLKAVGESMEFPMMYYENNFVGTANLMRAMSKHGCKTMVFSSSCTVYGMPKVTPLTEDQPRSAVSVYGRTKLMIEHMLEDIAKVDSDWRIILLRYFNPVGAHPTGRLGEHPKGVPLNLMPYVQQVALGMRSELKVYGSDYETRDGTCIRDFIHVMDLAVAHVAALNKVQKNKDYGCRAINIGTGKGTTVLEMIKAFEDASQAKVPYVIAERRPGDADAVWAATDLAEKELGWKAEYTLEDMCRHQWNWAKSNPKGYDS